MKQPLSVRLAAVLFVAYAVISLIWGASYWFLIGRPYVSVPLLLLYAAIAALYLWIAIKLMQLRRWALTAGQLLAVLAVVGGLSSLTSPSNFQHAGITILNAARLLIGIGLTIGLFLSKTARAFPKRVGSTARPDAPIGSKLES